MTGERRGERFFAPTNASAAVDDRGEVDRIATGRPLSPDVQCPLP